ncbi:MAG: hypothetical protein WC447_02680 [Candidatus Paceibacterota bacterium]|jgi:hypothetical protein
MTEKLKQKIKEEMINLPKESQDAINAFDWGNISEEIGKKNLLTESEVNDLQVETGLVLVGLVDVDEYALNIENNVGTSKEEAEKIAEEVNKKIFSPISETIRKTIEDNLKNKNLNWKQTLNFIVSGGDYSAFIKKENNSNIPTKDSRTTTLDNSSKITDIKNKFVI